jgi:monoamine oxidase
MAEDIYVILNSPVIKIQQDTKHVEVFYMKEGKHLKSIQSRYCIVAMDPNLCGKIQYSPHLPSLRDQLTTRMSPGKLVLNNISRLRNKNSCSL